MRKVKDNILPIGVNKLNTLFMPDWAINIDIILTNIQINNVLELGLLIDFGI